MSMLRKLHEFAAFTWGILRDEHGVLLGLRSLREAGAGPAAGAGLGRVFHLTNISGIGSLT